MKCTFPPCVTYESSLEILSEAFAYLPAAMNRLRAIDEDDDDDDGDNGEGRWQRACRPLTSNCFALITENNDLRPDNPGWIRQTKSTSGTKEVPERQMRVAADEIKQRTRQGRNKKGGRKKEKKKR
jgi:hypothetical protein